MISGESYIQYILDQLNGIEVRGRENMDRLMTAICMLETLRKDIVEHKKAEENGETV